MFPLVRAEAGRDLQRVRAAGQAVQEAAGQLGQTLGSRGGRQGRARGQELCQGAAEGELPGAQLQEETRVQEETSLQRD